MMEKVAVVGLSCLFPDAQTPEAFWENLMAQKDSTDTLIPEDLGGLDPQAFLSSDGANPDRAYSLRGGYIRNFKFDAAGYRVSAETLKTLDPAVQASLYTARQALLDSGYLNQAEALAHCGVVLGNLAFPTRFSNQLFAPIYQQTLDPVVKTLLGQDAAGLRSPAQEAAVSPLNAMTLGLPTMAIARALGLKGIGFSLDAACASSLYAVDLACRYLRSRKVDLMLAGAVSYADPIFTRMVFSGVQAYPKNGISRPLDQNSRGLTPADGVGMVVLKRYSDALRDGDHIYAIIGGIGLSNDGSGKHLLSPNQRGQQLAFERAYAEAGISPSEIAYLECHATGTLLGDTTELASIEEFWRRHAVPLLGVAKSNVGHLLTAAGMVGMIKVILAMSKDLVPATINLRYPISSPNGLLSGEHIVTSPTPWPRQTAVKRAAINAFGFGGTNAHLILEQGTQAAESPIEPSASSPLPLKPLAIVGMDACFGPYNGLEALERAIYEGQQGIIPLPSHRWRGLDSQKDLLQNHGFDPAEAPSGAYIEAFEIDTLRYKIPPNEVDSINPQQLLMLKVVDQALQDAQFKSGGNVAVIVAMESEPAVHQLQQRWQIPGQLDQGLGNLSLPAEQTAALETLLKDSLHPPAEMGDYIGHISNITASRISALWDFTGPAFALSAGENSTFKALEVAQLLLSAGSVEAVVVGAVDLAGGGESVLLKQALHPVNTGKVTLSYDRAAAGWNIGEGAGAVVLKAFDQCQKGLDEPLYARLEAISLVNANTDDDHFPPSPDSQTVTQACQQAFQAAGLAPASIEYLEVCGSGMSQADEAEIEGLGQAYHAAEQPLSCAIGSIKANIGHTHIASGMASLIKTVLCLHHRYIPAVPQWSSPKYSSLGKNSPFYVAPQSIPWFLDPTKAQRTAAINGMGIDGSSAHLILSALPQQQVRHHRYLTQMPLRLLPIAGTDCSALVEQLRQVQAILADGIELAALTQEVFLRFQQHDGAPYALSILGRTSAEINQEIQRALTGVVKAFETQGEWKSPTGSYFHARPLGPQGQVAFLYPGAFGAYVGLGCTRFRLFPRIYDDPILGILGNYTNTAERYLFPRSLKKLSLRHIEKIERQLMDNPLALLEAEIGCATLSTLILKDYFKISPQFVFGYSLGEISMMVAQGVWRDFAQGLEAFRTSTLFSDRLSGPKNAVRDYWQGLPEMASAVDDFWSTHVLMAPASAVKAVLETEPRVYLTQINTPQEVVIAGDVEGCQRVISTLGCKTFRAPFNHLIHCPPVQSEYGELVKLNTLPIQRIPEGVTFYSAAKYQPFSLDSQTIGNSVAQNLCQQFDFPRLVNQIYDQGARFFIEVGAGSTCSRWVGEILNQRDHLAESFDKRGMDDHTTALRLLAKLVSHRLPLDLGVLYEPAPAPQHSSRTMAKTIVLGGKPIQTTSLTLGQSLQFQPRVKLPQSSSPKPPTGAQPELPDPGYASMGTLNRRVAETQTMFLQARQEGLKHIEQSIQLQIELSRQILSVSAEKDDSPSVSQSPGPTDPG